MRLTQLIQLAAFLAVLAVSTGRLPQILRQVQIAKLHLIQESKASKWGTPMLLPMMSTK